MMKIFLKIFVFEHSSFCLKKFVFPREHNFEFST